MLMFVINVTPSTYTLQLTLQKLVVLNIGSCVHTRWLLAICDGALERIYVCNMICIY